MTNDNRARPGGGHLKAEPRDHAGAWVTEVLDAIAALGRQFQADLTETATMADVFAISRGVLRRVGDLEAVAFLALDEMGLGFEIDSFDSPNLVDELRSEIDHQIAEGTFAWALRQDRCIIAPGGHLAPWVVLHVLSTPSRVIGMLVGTLKGETPLLPDAARKAVSLILQSCASVLETSSLYREVAAQNRDLEATIEERTRELRRSEEQAHAATRAKSEFLANMSHEIRTPLNGILGMATILAESELSSDQREQLETVQRSGLQLLAIVNDLLDSSKIESGLLTLESVPFNLREVVDDVTELLATKASENQVELVVRYPADAPRDLEGDPHRIQQVLTNLVGNAVKFTSEGYVQIDVHLDGDSGRLQIDVEDTGIGIAPDSLDRMFETFTQADVSTTRRFGGSGLGLSISRHLARQMGGDIEAHSREGVGSVFTFTLPVGEVGSISAPPVLHGERVLLVLEDERARASLVELIETTGGQALEVGKLDSVVPTLWKARKNREPMKWVFVDAVLEERELERLASAFRESPESSETKLVGLVPYGCSMTAERLYEIGFDHVLNKPVRERRVRELLAGSKSRRPAVLADVAEVPHAKVLVAEDDPVNSAVVVHMLKLMNCEAHTVSNGKAAVEAIKKERFDLVLMDSQMPIMDGYEATTAIRALDNGDVPIIALTASAMPIHRERSRQAGMKDHLTKPLLPAELRDVLIRWVPAPTGSSNGSDNGSSSGSGNALGNGSGNGSSDGVDNGSSDGVDNGSSNGVDNGSGRGLGNGSSEDDFASTKGSDEGALPILSMDGRPDRFADNETAFENAVDGFLAHWPELRSRLHRGVITRDGQELSFVAHRIRGGAAIIGAERVAAHAESLESDWEEGRLDDLESQIQKLENLFEQLGQVIEARGWRAVS